MEVALVVTKVVVATVGQTLGSLYLNFSMLLYLTSEVEKMGEPGNYVPRKYIGLQKVWGHNCCCSNLNMFFCSFYHRASYLVSDRQGHNNGPDLFLQQCEYAFLHFWNFLSWISIFFLSDRQGHTHGQDLFLQTNDFLQLFHVFEFLDSTQLLRSSSY